MTGAELRERFLNYFGQRDHNRLASSSLVPEGDATLLFTNAGMVQFKKVFTGQEKRDYKRAVTAQKCLRVSGKHNDLENVGHTARHHTFFEMLGNFSFGDYFKKEAIAFGWEFLTLELGLPKKDLHVTIYTDDDEAEGLWKSVLGKNSNPIGRLGEKDNFWSMGDTGPCGPCSEIHIDQGPRLGCGSPDCGPACDCDRFLELWNLVFMQFDRDSTGKMTPLPRPSIDTGLGLERLAAVVQGKDSNWESDLFVPIINRIEKLTHRKCHGQDFDSIAIRVIADHSRAAAFLISDGVLPSNEGRGYVLRRIMRRAIRYGKYIGLNEPFLFDTSGVVIDHMSDAYPELATHRTLINKVIRNEEERFLETLSRGLLLFEEEVNKVRNQGLSILPGSVVFKLYDTFGFPPDLTQDLAAESGLAVDHDGFESEMSRQKSLARDAWDTSQGSQKPVDVDLTEKIPEVEFTGYDRLDDTGVVVALIKDQALVENLSAGDSGFVICDRTPFYAESGGQVGDQGIIEANGNEVIVEDTVKAAPGIISHKVKVKRGTISKGQSVTLSVNQARRKAIMANHSATHLLQWALREVLGDHVGQRGSLVEPGRFRFDFTHFSAIGQSELDKVEDLVNQAVTDNLWALSRIMPVDQAIAEGAMALFGEKYGDAVRMITIGDLSKELCGGTHVQRSGDIGLFKILSEGGIASGVRRMEGVTGSGAIEYVRSLEGEIRQLSEKLRGSRGELVKKLDKLIDEKKAREREIDTLKQKLSSGGGSKSILDGLREINGVRVITQELDDVSDPKSLREYGDRLKDALGSGIALVGARADDKVLLLALVTKDLTDRFHAGKIVKKAATELGGSGGGRPDMAQAGGPDVTRMEQALKSIEEFF
jgi:alanyl-tRNA synthetase